MHESSVSRKAPASRYRKKRIPAPCPVRYRLELPSEEELRRELERERRLLEEQESGFEVKEGRVVYGKRVKRKKR